MSKERTQSNMSLASGSIKEFKDSNDQIITDSETIPRTVPDLEIEKLQDSLTGNSLKDKLNINVNVDKENDLESPLSFDSNDVPPEWLDGEDKDIKPTEQDSKPVAIQKKLTELDRDSFKSAVDVEQAEQLEQEVSISNDATPLACTTKVSPVHASRGEFSPLMTPIALEPFPSAKQSDLESPRQVPTDDHDLEKMPENAALTIDTAPNEASEAILESIITSPVEELKLVAGMSLYVTKMYKAQDLDELDLEAGDIIELDSVPEDEDEFWLKGTIRSWGKKNGQQGFFPRDHVVPQDSKNDIASPEQEVMEIEESQPEQADPLPNESVEPVPKGTTVIAMYAYEPVKADELALVQGATIVVMECPEGGWWKGVAGIEDKKPVTGWFPATLVKVKDDAKSKGKLEHLRSNSTPTSSNTSIDSVKQDPLHGDKKLSWFKKLRSVNDNTVIEQQQDNDKRKRAVSAPSTALTAKIPNGNLMVEQHGALVEEGSIDLLNNAHSSIESFPASTRTDPSTTTKNDGTKGDTVYDFKPVGDDNKPGVRPNRATSILASRESTHSGSDVKPRSRAESVYTQRQTIVIPNSLSTNDAMQGASDETVQDKVGANVYKFLPDQEKKRLNATWELIQTERDYCRDLSIIIEFFMKPMANMPSVGPKNMQILFSNIEQIFSINMDFLYLLQQIEDIRQINTISEVFLMMGERFMCYIPYCSNQQTNSTKLLKSILSKGEIKSFLEDVYKNPICRQLDLPAFLLKPVQRICKYPLLIKEMIKNTPKEHSDLVNLNRAMERMQNGVATINECARKLGGMKPVIEVQNRFAEKINIANSNNRFLVREDTVQVMFNDGRKNRKIFLFNDLLILARRDWRDKHHVIEKTSLKDIRVSDISETGGNGSTTTLIEIEVLPNSEFDPPNRYIVSTISSADKLTWLEAYKSLVRYNVKSKDINDITMTSSSADGAGDEDDERPREPSSMEDDAVKTRKLAEASALEEKTKQLTSKIELLEKIVTEKDGTIKEWEAKILKLEAESSEKIKVLQGEVVKKDQSLEESSNKSKALEQTISELNAKVSLKETENLSYKKERELQFEELTKRNKAIEIELSLLKTTCAEQDANNGELKDINASLTSRVKEKEKSLKLVHAELEEYKSQMEQVEQQFSKKMKEKDSIITKADLQVQQLNEEQMFTSSRIQEVCSMLGMNIKRDRYSRIDERGADLNEGYRIGKSSLSIHQSVSHLGRSSMSGMDRSDAQYLEYVKGAIDDLIKQNAEKQAVIQEKTITMNSLSDQLTQAKRQLSDKENNISDTSMQRSFLQKRVSELETNITNNEVLITQLKKELLQNETLLEEQRTHLKKVVAEKENSIIELKSQLKQELENIRILNSTVKNLENDVLVRDASIKESTLTIQQANSKYNTLSAEHAEKEVLVKQLTEKSSTQKQVLEELQNVLLKAQNDSIINFEVQGGVVAQFKSYLSGTNGLLQELKTKKSELETTNAALKTTLATAQEKLASSEHQLNIKTIEAQELDISLVKTKEKLSQTKDELTEAQAQVDANQMLMMQLRNNVEQSRGTIEHMKLATQSLERQQKQLQLALDETRKECVTSLDKIKQLQSTIQSQTETISDLEHKTSEQSQSLKDRDTQYEGLSRKLKEKEASLLGLEKSHADLTNQKSTLELSFKKFEAQSETSHRELEEKISELQKVIKAVKAESLEKEQEKNQIKEQLLAEKERQKFDVERDIAHLKSQLSESEAQLFSAQQKLQQKDARANDLEATIKDLKFKCTDLETNISNLQSKLLVKDSKYSEVESLTNSQISNINQLKQKISEQEMAVMNLQSKLLDSEAKGQRQDNLLAASSSTISSLEQRVLEFKLQIDTQSDLIKKLDREKRDLATQLDQSEHSSASIAKELRMLKEQSQQLMTDLAKAQQTLSVNARDSQRDLQSLEEKHKLQLSKEISERDSEISLLRSEMQNLKQHHLNEFGRVKSELEANIRDQIKSHQEELKAANKVLEDVQEQTRLLQLKHKDELAHVSMDLKQAHQVELHQLKAKQDSAIEILKANVSDATQKVLDLEREIGQLQTVLKQKEMESMRFQLEYQKSDEDCKRIRAQMIVLEESHYAKIKTFERDLQEKEEGVFKMRGETDSVTKRKNELEDHISSLQLQLASEQSIVQDLRKKVDDLTSSFKEQEFNHFSEITNFKGKLQDAEKSRHESLLLIERLRAIEDSLKQSLEKLRSDFDLLSLKSDKQVNQIQDLIQEKQTLIHQLQTEQDRYSRKEKESSVSESSIQELNNTIKQRDANIQEVTLKNDRLEAQVSQLQHNIVIYQQDLEESKQTVKKIQEEDRDSIKKLGKESKKKLQQELESLSQKLMGEHSEQIQKLGQQHLEQIQRIVAEHEKSKDVLNQQLHSKSEQLSLFEMNLKSLAFEKKTLQDQVKDLESFKATLGSELEDKTNLIIQLKEKLKDVDTKYQVLNGKHQFLQSQLDEVKKSFELINAQNQERLLVNQKLCVEIDQSRKQIQELEGKLSDFTTLKSKKEEQEKDLQENQSIIEILEAQILGLQRLLSKETKLMASMQLTLLELASMVSLQLPWNMNDIMSLPEKLKTSFKAGKARAPFENIDHSVLLEIVSTIRHELSDKDRVYQEYVKSSERCMELENLQEQLQAQLADASNALSIVEERIHSQADHHTAEREKYKLKMEQLQKALDKALSEMKKNDQKSNSLEEKLKIVEQEKASLEQDFIQLYEKLQLTKQAFLERSKTISADTSLLLEEYNESRRMIKQRDDEISKLNDALLSLDKTQKLTFLQKEKVEKLLKEATDSSKLLGSQLQTLKQEREKLVVERNDLETRLNSTIDAKNREIELLAAEYEHAEQKILKLGDSMTNTSKIIEEFKDKWSRSLQREKELENRNQMLLVDISSLKSQMTALQESQNHGSNEDELLSLQAQIATLDRNYARLKKDKIVLEQEVLLLRTKQQRQMLPDPRQLNLLPNPNDV